MSTALATNNDNADLMERVIMQGDLSRLTPQDRVSYYNAVCQSIGINPLTQPFAYMKLQGKETLYAKKDCAEQLRSSRKLSITIVGRELLGDVYVVTARVADPSGRCDESTGAVTVKGLSGENLANAYMKAETKAKRRATLSLCGLGFMPDESEIDGIRQAPAEQPPPARRITSGVAHVEPTYASVLAGIESAETEEELQSVSEAAKRLSPQEKAKVKIAYVRRGNELRGVKAEAPHADEGFDPNTGEVIEPGADG